MRKMIKQVIRFGIVGGLASGIDYFIMILLTEIFGIYYLISNAVSFTISVSFNYVCSMKFVFVGKKEISKRKEFFVFIILSIIGLFINQLVMWFVVEKLGIFYAVTKLFATVVVMIWNFISRKIFIESRD